MKQLLSLFIVFLSFNSFATLKNHLHKEDFGGLESILKKKFLRVLTTRNAYDYYIYQGNRRGFQYEMVSEFVDYLNKKYVKKDELKIAFELVPVDFEQLIPLLNSGKGDIIAVGLTKTKDREKLISFADPYRVVDEVIVTRKELQNNDWKKAKFHIQKESSFYYSLKKQLELEQINVLDANFNSGQLMDFISIGHYDYTLVNSFWAKTISKLYNNLIVLDKVPFRKKIEISWGVRKASKRLLNELNEFIPKIKKGTAFGNLLGYKYFYNVARIKTASLNLTKNEISAYDDLFKKYAKMYDLDWRLVAAVSFQESRFDQSIINKWGAIGLMQVKQMTANEPYIKIPNISGIENSENNIHAGVKYLAWIKNRYLDSNVNMSEDDRIRMMLAAYNAGPSRMLRARKKAKEMGLDQNKWFRHTELAMLNLGYHEPIVYVSEINKHFVSFDLLGIK